MKIDELHFRAGAEPCQSPLTLNPGSITVFIGPNNGGKSAALRELHHYLAYGRDPGLVVRSIVKSQLTAAEIDEKLKFLTISETEVSSRGAVLFGARGQRQEVVIQHLKEQLNSAKNERYSQWVHETFFAHYVLNLDGESRLGMVANGGAQDLKQRPQSTLAALFMDDALRKKVAEIVHDAFGQYLVIDPTSMGQLQYAFSDALPSDALARSFGHEAIEFFGKCPRIDRASDGTKAFIGIIAEVLAGFHDILLIDEPEAFLHPSLAYLLGREVARNMTSQKQMFVSTHSPHFLMGCMSVGVPVDIVRLTYKSGNATARLLPAQDLRRMMSDPLLKSIGVLGSLFYESVVLVEADSDRAFYEEINSRLHLYAKGGIRHTAFLNAHNKQEAVHIARVLRNVGIPSAIILDIDWIKEDGKVGQRYLAAAGVPQGLRSGILDMRRRVRSYFDAVDGDYKTNGGLLKLSGEEFATAKSFFDQLETYGLFTVRNGELESWLVDLGITARKDQWLGKVFERMGSDPTDGDFVRPTEADVWNFIRSVGGWIGNPRRDGMLFVDPNEL